MYIIYSISLLINLISTFIVSSHFHILLEMVVSILMILIVLHNMIYLYGISRLYKSQYINRLQMNLIDKPSLNNIVIVGSGPSGLATAIMLAKKGISNIKLYDQLKEPSRSDDSKWGDFETSRSYNIGLSGRGQKVLNSLGVLDRIVNASSEMKLSKQWSVDTPILQPIDRNLTRPNYQTICLERDR